MSNRLIGRVRAPSDRLSVRELEVLTPAPPIAAASGLFISEATVKNHLLHIYAGSGVKDRAAATAAAVERGLPHRR